MNAENLMHAIGGISDRYVAEFAEVRPVTPKRCRRHRLGALAACVCLALTAIVWVVYNAAPFPSDRAIWAESADAAGLAACMERSEKGVVLLTESLQDAVSWPSSNAGQLVGTGTARRPTSGFLRFWLRRRPGASEEVVYETFVKPLGVEEDYLGAGIIFVTKEQLRELVCPEGLALVLVAGRETCRGLSRAERRERI